MIRWFGEELHLWDLFVTFRVRNGRGHESSFFVIARIQRQFGVLSCRSSVLASVGETFEPQSRSSFSIQLLERESFSVACWGVCNYVGYVGGEE